MRRIHDIELNRRWRLLSVSAAIIAIFTGEPLAAQTVDAPTRVCQGEQFGVEWTGPDSTGDTITVAGEFLPADEFNDATPTADGNPATLRAPFTVGQYDIRYVANEPLDILVKDQILVERCGGGSSDEEEWPQVAVEARGTQIDYGDQINRSDQTPYGPAGYTIDQLCGGSDDIAWAMQTMVDQVEASMVQAGSPVTFDMVERLPGAPTRAGIQQDMSNLRDAVCDQPPPGTTVQPFVVTYAYCRMAMYTPTHAMDIHLPPGAGDGTMSMADHTTREVMKMTLRRSFEAAATVTGTGWGDEINMSPPRPAASRIGYPTREYDYEYSGGLGRGGGSLTAVASMITTQNTGTVWVSSQVPGIDIVRIFYERLARDVETDGGAMSFFGGLIQNLVGMLRKGLPLEIDSTVSSKILGATAVSGRTRNILSSVRLVKFYPEWCTESLMPTGYAVTDIDQQISEAMGASGMDSAEMSAAMQEYNQAMQQMTHEERAIMESMGMGDMMQQAMQGAGAGAAAMTASGTPAGGSNMPSSAELTTDDLIQTVQNHLQALGYEPGNTDGDVSLETTIAISQFQADKGIEVTGEVTPQLVGILSAEVDSR